MTVDQGADMDRYQGIVPLDGGDLTSAAQTYFAQSEQIPTSLRLAAGPLLARGQAAEAWRAGAIMVQHLPREGGASPLPVSSGDAPMARKISLRNMMTGSRQDCSCRRRRLMKCSIRN